jgi:type IV pilus assembly protein PilE
MQNAQFMERLYTESGCYNPGDDGVCNTADDESPDLPLPNSPIDDGTKYYDVSLASVTASTFNLTAEPKNAQSDDDCGKLTLNHLGIKDVEDEVIDNDCWRN